MITGISIHEVVKVEISKHSSGQIEWMRYIFTDEDGARFEVVTHYDGNPPEITNESGVTITEG